ncbi:MAG: hypothetical protein KGY45_04055 [Hadesarchaea archaeon]|nr:hypothetical protein [Hadesarchaea archaeon]
MKDKIIPEDSVTEEMKRIGVRPEGIKIMREKAIFRILRLDNIISPMANLIKEEMLATGGDAAVHKHAISRKVEHTDVILFGTLHQYKRFTQKMKKQPHGAEKIAERVEELLEDLLEE